MKLHLQTTTDINLVTAYGEDFIAVNGTRYGSSLIIMPELIIPDWDAKPPAELTPEHFSDLMGLGLEVLLLGTGDAMRFPSPVLMGSLAKQGVGLESMDTFAACRTYNILAGEGRKVAAALILKTA